MPGSQFTRYRWLYLCHLLTLTLAALHLYVWRLPRTTTAMPAPGSAEAKWWGLWPVTYLSGWVLGSGLALLLLLLVLIYNEQIWQRIYRWATREPRWFHWLPLLALFLMLFYTFPTVHTRWGDAYILTKAIALDDPALRLTHSWQAPLDLWLHSQLWLRGHAALHWPDAMPVYHLLSPLAGLLYLSAAVAVARMLRPLPAWLPFALLTSLGVMQLFFGYIENYTFAAAGILLYLWVGLGLLRGQRSLWLLSLTLAVTNALHPSTVVYWPSLLYCGWQVYQRQRARSPAALHPLYLTGIQLALPMLLVGGGLIVMMETGGHGIATLLTTDRPGGGDARWLVPLWQTTTRWEHYTLFSWPHVRDLFNQQLLVAPIILPGLLIFWATGSATVAGQPLRQRHFLLIAAAAHLLLTWIWNPDYGGQRDWDLFSLAAIPLTVFLAHLLASEWQRAAQKPAPKPTAANAEPASGRHMIQRMVMRGIIPLLVLQYLHTAAWIYQNTLPWEWP